MSRVHLITCVGVEQDLALLPHFLRYYAGLGVPPRDVHPVLNAPDASSPALAEARAVLRAHGVEPAEVWVAPYTSGAMWEKRREVQRRVASAEDWVISADVDEFHEFPDALGPFLAYCERRGVNCVQGVFIDRLAADGRLKAVEPEPSLWEQFPVQADLACVIRSANERGWQGGTVNLMAMRGDILPRRGGHSPYLDGPDVSFLLGSSLSGLPWITVPAFRFSVPLRVHHFKWTSDLLVSSRRRMGTPGASKAELEYGQLIIDFFEKDSLCDFSEIPTRGKNVIDLMPWKIASHVHRLNPVARRFRDKASSAVSRFSI